LERICFTSYDPSGDLRGQRIVRVCFGFVRTIEGIQQLIKRAMITFMIPDATLGDFRSAA
jgi:hypothetical protein